MARVTLFLLEVDSEASGGDGAVGAEGLVFVGDRVPVEEDKDRRCREFYEKGDKRCSILRR